MAVVLGIDSSGRMASAALIREDEVLAEMSVSTNLTHSETLLPMIDEIVQKSGIRLSEVTCLAVAAGPGSFTGLRIGAATVKGLGFVLNVPVAAVSTLEGLAYQMYGTENLIVPLMDARRGQVYTAAYTFEKGTIQEKKAPRPAALDEVIQEINEEKETFRDKAVIFCGDGASAFRDKLESAVQVPHFFAPAAMNRQRAAAVASRGLEIFRAGKAVSADLFVPEYLRPSQAERNRMKTHAEGH